MVKRKKTKIAALVLAFGLILVYASTRDYIGWSAGSPAYTRFLYQFFHVSWLHVLLNSWAFVSVVFLCDFSLVKILLAYVASASMPAPEISTIGFSGVCFALFGMASFLSANKLRFHFWIAIYILIGWFFNANATLHLYCYLAGLLVGWLDSPAK